MEILDIGGAIKNSGSNSKPEVVLSSEVNFDTRKVLNRSNKIVSNDIIEEIETKGVSLERLDELDLPIYKYQTQITIHGIFKGLKNERVGGYKNLILNQNETLGVKYNAIDLEKKRIINRALRLYRNNFNDKDYFKASMDSKGFEISKYKSAKSKEELLSLVEEFKKELNLIPDNFIGKKSVFRYYIPMLGFIAEINIDLKAIRQENLWDFISSITDGKINEKTYNELVEKERQEYAKQQKENEEKKKNEQEEMAKQIEKLKSESTFNKINAIPSAKQFIISFVIAGYSKATIRTFFVFENKQGRLVYNTKDYYNWSDVPTTISNDILNSRGNSLFNEKLINSYLSKANGGYLVYESKPISRSMYSVDKPSFTKTERTVSVPSGDNILIDNDNYVLIESKHTKTGDKIIVLKIKKSLDRDEYKKVESLIKGIRGYYSGFVKGFILKSALSQNELNNLLKDTSLYSETKFSEDKDIDEAAKQSVEQLVKEEGLSEEQATEQMKKGVEVEMEHKDMLEQVASGNMDVDTAVAETAEEHIKEVADYYDKLEQVEKKDENIFSNLEDAKKEYPIVLEWSEGLAFENKGYNYLYELEKDLKKAGFTDSPNDTYVKNKVWFRDYPSYVKIDNSKIKGDFNVETQSLEDYLKEYDKLYDWTIYEYGDNYKFGTRQEEKKDVESKNENKNSFEKGDLVIADNINNNVRSYSFEWEKFKNVGGEVLDYKYNSEEESYYYSVKNIFNEEVYSDVPERYLRKTTKDILEEENKKNMLLEGKLPLLTLDEAKKISDSYLEKFKDENVFETPLVSSLLKEYFKDVVCVRPEYLYTWLDLVEKIKHKKTRLYILESLTSYSDFFDIADYKNQFYNSMINANKEKGTSYGISELSGLTEHTKQVNVNPVNYKLDATDEGLYSIIKDFLSDDVLRHNLACFNLDDNGVEATDAHRFIFIKGDTNQKGMFRYIKKYDEKEYKDFKKYKGDLYKYDGGKYPNYQVILPTEIKSVNVFSKESIQSVFNSLDQLLKYKILNNSTNKIAIRLNDSKECFYLNGEFLLEALKSMFKLDFDNLEITYDTNINRRNMLLFSKDVKSFVNLKESGCLIMGLRAGEIYDSLGVVEEPSLGELYIDFRNGSVQTKGITDENNEYIATLDDLESYLELIDMTIEAEENKEAKEDLISYKELIILTIEDLKSKQ